MSNDYPDSTLTFTDTKTFHHWLKRQRKTSFSIPVQMRGSVYCFDSIDVSKRALNGLTIADKEVIKVEMSVGKYTGWNYSFVQPESIRGHKNK